MIIDVGSMLIAGALLIVAIAIGWLAVENGKNRRNNN